MKEVPKRSDDGGKDLFQEGDLFVLSGRNPKTNEIPSFLTEDKLSKEFP